MALNLLKDKNANTNSDDENRCAPQHEASESGVIDEQIKNAEKKDREPERHLFPLFGWLSEAGNNPHTREAEYEQRNRRSNAKDEKLLNGSLPVVLPFS